MKSRSIKALGFFKATRILASTEVMTTSSSSGKRKISDFNERFPEYASIDDKFEEQAQVKAVQEESTVDKQGGIVPKYDLRKNSELYSISNPPTKGDYYFDIQIYEWPDIKDQLRSELWMADGKRIKFTADEDDIDGQLIRKIVAKVSKEIRENHEKIVKPPVKRTKKSK